MRPVPLSTSALGALLLVASALLPGTVLGGTTCTPEAGDLRQACVGGNLPHNPCLDQAPTFHAAYGSDADSGVATYCGVPTRPCDSGEAGVSATFEDGSRAGLCGLRLPSPVEIVERQPCLDDVPQCVAENLRRAQDRCSPYNLVVRTEGASADGRESFSEVYAVLKTFTTDPAHPERSGRPVYDLYHDYYLAPVSAGMTVPAQGYAYSTGIHWTTETGALAFAGIFDKSLAKPCTYLTTIVGNAFVWDVHGGDYGWETSSTCTWEVHAEFTAGVSWGLTVGWGGSGSVTLGGSYTCSDSKRMQSEATLATFGPPWPFR